MALRIWKSDSIAAATDLDSLWDNPGFREILKPRE